ncbi:MAG: protein kinase [Candidatus Obscuribacterales bacterium]|nr:protein kinase [Candidatus Obscuribacterales bacterium]
MHSVPRPTNRVSPQFKPTILLVEDQPLTLLGIKMSLQELQRYEIVGEATNGLDAVAMAKRLHPDVILMDVSLPGMDGIEASWQIKQDYPRTKIVMFTSHHGSDVVAASLGAGAEAYLLKDRSVDQIAQAIDTVFMGKIWIDPLVADRVVRDNDRVDKTVRSDVSQLSPMELNVLKLIRDGLDNKTIATQLRTSEDAVAALMRGLLQTFESSARTSGKQAAPDPAVISGGNSARNSHTDLPAIDDKWLEASMDMQGAMPAQEDLFEGKYLMQSVIGEGGGGVVVRAEHIYMKRPVALKILHQALIEDLQAMRSFRREAMSIACLDNDNVIRVYDFGVSEKREPYIVMELFEGTTLKQILVSEQRLALTRFYVIFSQVCSALIAAHAQNLIHCDIKPSNILVDEKIIPPVVKLADFGLAKKIIKDDEGAASSEETPTVVSGTPAYMSPEQCTAQPLDERSDVYSLGCVMFEALTGHRVFPGNTTRDIFVKHVQEKPPSMLSVCPQAVVPEELEGMISLMLAKEPDDRIQKVADVLAMLSDILEP